MKVYCIYFSPTGGTEKITKIIAEEFGEYIEIDLSKREVDYTYSFEEDDICLIGLPSYGGRVPEIALNRMEAFKGNNSKAILIIAYGNREFDDSFVELEDFLLSKDFNPIGGVAGIAEHSIAKVYGSGRPNEEDKMVLGDFAKSLREKINSTSEDKPTFPGNRPYRDYKKGPLLPLVDSTCIRCGICAESCPVGAIAEDQPDTTDEKLCIGCMRCIKVCPTKSRSISDQIVKATIEKLKESASIEKENQLFI